MVQCRESGRLRQPRSLPRSPVPVLCPQQCPRGAMSQSQSRTDATPHAHGPADFDAFLAKLSERDRGNIVRQLSVFETENRGAHAKLFRRLAATLASLAPHGLQTKGQRAIQFFVADGKYRMQLFALEDPHDDTLNIYSRDTIKEAVRSKVLGPLARSENDIHYYRVRSEERRVGKE